jgi:hypothetical protein
MLRYCFIAFAYFSMTLSAAAFHDIGVSTADTRKLRVYVQVARRNDEQAASAFSAVLKERYGHILGEHAILISKSEVREVDSQFEIGGSWNDRRWRYRVLVGPMERGEAHLLCERLKGAGLKACFVRAQQR